MYEKKINLFDSIDREILNQTFVYNVIFFIILLTLFFIILFLKINDSYQNSISFINGKEALIFVDSNYLDVVNNSQKISLNNVEYDYNIEKIEEVEKGYLVSISFNNELNLKTENYQLVLKEKSLLEYFIKVIKGE